MNRVFSIISLVSLLYFAALIVGGATYEMKERNEIEQLKLSYAIDYATDAGTQEMLRTGNLDMDYSNKNYVNLNPELALDAFLTVFAFNYDMLPNAENKNLIKQYIPVAAVTTFDGVYIAEHKLIKNSKDYPENSVDDGDWDLSFNMKTPYSYSYNNTNYALNMGMDYSIGVKGNVMQKYSGLPPSSIGKLSEQDVWSKINQVVFRDMSYSINKANEENPNWKNNFYIPDRFGTISGVNPIQGPSFITLVQGLDFTTARPISAFSISGSKIEAARMVAAYTRNGTKYYCYVDKAPGSVTIENLYTSVQDAAEAGYSHDTTYME